MTLKVNRVRNWTKYNEALVNRGSINLWFSEDMIKNWHDNDSLKKRGRPKKYSDVVITCGLTLKAVYKLTFRSVEGFIRSLIDRLKIKVEAPDYTLLCKRQKSLKVNIRCNNINLNERINILVDTTGLKVFGEGEWKVRQHGYMKKRLWRKLHLGINASNQEIEAFELKELGFQDGDGLPLLVEQIEKRINSITADGAYDQYKIYRLAKEKNFRLTVPPNKKAKLTTECTGHSTIQKHTPEMLEALKERDAFIERIRKVGRKEWKKEVGYHRRSLAETGMFRIKALLGNRLKTRKFENQKIEVAIWCKVINQMTRLGMPIMAA